MKRLLKYLNEYKKETILGPIFKLFEAICDLIVPIVVSMIIDNGILKENNSYVIKMCLVLIILAIFGVIVSIIAQYFSAKASVGLGAKLRENLFNYVQSFSFKNLDSVGESTIINRITNDTLQVQSGVNLLLRLALRSPFIVFGSLIMASLINVKAGIIFTFIVPIIAIIIFIITKICVPKYEKIQDKKDNLLNITKETLSGARVIRVFGIEDDEYNEFKNENLLYTEYQEEASIFSSSMHSLNYIIINLGIIGIIAVGGVEVNTGILTQGQVVALYNYMSQILIEIIKLTNLLLLIPKTVASTKRIENIFSMKPAMENGTKKIDSNQIELEFDNVCLNYIEDLHEKKVLGVSDKEIKSYVQKADEGYNKNTELNRKNDTVKNEKQHIESLSGINFEAKTGETIGIIGGTGSGKTSLINLIPRFYDVTSGAIKINGKNIKEYDLDNLRENVGIVMQNKVLFRGSIEENIKFGSENLNEKELEKALDISQAKEFVENREGGIKEYVEENGKNFSGGQRQRLTIARVIARNPKIMIFDDSMSALDLATDKKLRNELNKIKSDKLLIIVSQRISTIKNLDKILVLDNGKIVGQGKHEELLENCEVYREIYASQNKMLQ